MKPAKPSKKRGEVGLSPGSFLMEHAPLNLREFDFRRELGEKFGFYLLLGKRNTGKTTWCRYVNRFLRSAEEGIVVVVVDNVKLKHAWSRYVPVTHIYTAAEFQVVEHIQDVQNSVYHTLQKHGLHEDADVRYKMSVTIILDDLGAHHKIMNSHALKNLAATGRHINANVFMLLQHLKQAPPVVRNQFQTVFMLQCSSQDTVKTVHREYVSMVDYNDFREVLNSVTANYGLLVINCDSKASHSVQDVCSFAELDPAEIERAVQLGKPQQWEFAEENYLENEICVDLLRDDSDATFEHTQLGLKPSTKARVKKIYS